MLLQRELRMLKGLRFNIWEGRRFMTFFPVDDNSYGLDAEKQKLRKTAFDFFQKELAPHAQEIDKNDEFADFRSFWKKMGEQNFHGITADRQFGGLGGSYLDHCIIMEEMSRASSGIALSYGSHSNLCIDQISKNGNELQKKMYLPQLCSGQKVGGLAVSEFGSSHDLDPQLRVEKHGEEFVLNGKKVAVTNGGNADILVLFAKPDGQKSSNTAFIVETNSTNVKPGQKLKKTGMRGSNTYEIIFDNLKVPEQNILGELDTGSKVLTKGLDMERLILAAGPVGLMQAACDIAFDYAHYRKRNKPLKGEIQHIQQKLSDMFCAMNPCRSYLYSVARAVDSGNKNSSDCSGVLLYCAEKAPQVVMDALRILSRKGCEHEKCAERLLRDARLYEVAAESSEIRTLMVEGHSSDYA